jgi:hypothetical protein
MRHRGDARGVTRRYVRRDDRAQRVADHVRTLEVEVVD